MKTVPRAEVSVIAMVLFPKASPYTMSEENGVVGIAIAGRQRRVNEGRELHVGKVAIPNVERIRGGLIVGTESVLQRLRSTERKMHQDRAVERPTAAVQVVGVSGTTGENYRRPVWPAALGS